MSWLVEPWNLELDLHVSLYEVSESKRWIDIGDLKDPDLFVEDGLGRGNENHLWISC